MGKEVRPFQGSWKHDTENDILPGAGSRPRPSGNVVTIYTPLTYEALYLFIQKDNCNCEQNLTREKQREGLAK